MDNNRDLSGQLFENRIPIIGIDEYMMKYRDYEIVIAMIEHSDVERQLQELGIDNYRVAEELSLL